MALIDPDTAFWSLVRKDRVGETLSGGPFDLAQGRPEGTRMGGKLLADYRRKADAFAAEMQKLRFGLKPSAVYFNPTERCNLDCRYCYIPSEMRRHGEHMSRERLMEAMARLDSYFAATLPKTMRPQIVFHGAEPMLNREAVFAAIEAYRERFLFGIQTNATLLDEEAVTFLTDRGVSLGLSLDAANPAVAQRTRRTWDGKGVFDTVVKAMRRLRGYENWSVICTVTKDVWCLIHSEHDGWIWVLARKDDAIGSEYERNPLYSDLWKETPRLRQNPPKTDAEGYVTYREIDTIQPCKGEFLRQRPDASSISLGPVKGEYLQLISFSGDWVQVIEPENIKWLPNMVQDEPHPLLRVRWNPKRTGWIRWRIPGPIPGTFHVLLRGTAYFGYYD